MYEHWRLQVLKSHQLRMMHIGPGLTSKLFAMPQIMLWGSPLKISFSVITEKMSTFSKCKHCFIVYKLTHTPLHTAKLKHSTLRRKLKGVFNYFMFWLQTQQANFQFQFFHNESQYVNNVCEKLLETCKNQCGCNICFTQWLFLINRNITNVNEVFKDSRKPFGEHIIKEPSGEIYV